jgi:hypothetical protein
VVVVAVEPEAQKNASFFAAAGFRGVGRVLGGSGSAAAVGFWAASATVL